MRWRGAALVCLAAMVSACGQTTILQRPSQRVVAEFVFKHTGFRPTDVRCPSGIPAKVGNTFQCHFTGPDGPYTAYVRIVSVHGRRVVDYIVTRPNRNKSAG